MWSKQSNRHSTRLFRVALEILQHALHATAFGSSAAWALLDLETHVVVQVGQFSTNFFV